MKIDRLVIAVSKSGKVYHYFRPCKMITRQHIYWVSDPYEYPYHSGIEFDNDRMKNMPLRYDMYLMVNKKKVVAYDEILEVIENAKIVYARDKRIKYILTE